MFKLIEDMPPGVLAIEATGKVTHQDYENVLIPEAEAMMAKGPIDMLYVIGKDFTGYELQALWDDSSFGVKHWREFKHVAVVGDQSWLHAAVAMFSPFFPCEVRLFNLSDLPVAKLWIKNAQKAA
ncbi:MAG: STAS/SEC14 domain-containing protein [Alphaproteobacteria bacterium]